MAERDAKGQFVAGHKKKGGIKKGEHQKASRPIRELLTNFQIENWDNFLQSMKEMRDESPKDYVKAYLDTLKYTCAALQAINFDVTQQTKNTIEDILVNAAKNAQ